MLFWIHNVKVFWHSECNSTNQTLYYCFLFYITLLSLMDKVLSDQLRSEVLIVPFICSVSSSYADTNQGFLSQDLDTLWQREYIDVIKTFIIMHSALQYACLFSCCFLVYGKSNLQMVRFMFNCDFIFKFSLLLLQISNCLVIIFPDMNSCISIVLNLLALYLYLSMTM